MTAAKTKWQKMWRNEEGIAFLEFALALPILMALLLGGIEISRYVQASQKIDKVTHTIVDLVAQAPTVSRGELDQIMLAVEHIMTPLRFGDDGVIIISCVGYNDRGQLRVKWQYRGGGTFARNSNIGAVNSAPTLPTGFVIEERENVIIAEAFYFYEPLVNEEIVSPIEFYRTAFYLPRLGELDTLAP